MAADPLPQQQILEILNKKANTKSKVYDQSIDVFNQLKEVLSELSNDLNDLLETDNNRRVRLEYRDRGKFEAELKFADDVLVFSMHTDVFQFDRDHSIWKSEYVQNNDSSTYCGVINVYNILSDSLKYNREDDLGYLVARMFINKDRKFFVEGKRQLRRVVSDFGKYEINKDELVSFVEAAMFYSISFDLLVPPFNSVKEATVAQINIKTDEVRMSTGKRIGYKYNSDDVLED